METTVRVWLLAEAAELRRLLDRLPAGDWMTRPSFEVRL